MDDTNTERNENLNSTSGSGSGSINNNPRNENPNPTSGATNNPNSIAPSFGPGKTDPAWAYVSLKKEGKVNVFTCLFCASSYRGGGINRMKQHLAGVSGQVCSCKKVSHDVRARMKESLVEGSKKKHVKHVEDDTETREIEELVDSPPLRIGIESSGNKRKAPEAGRVDNYFAPRTSSGSQPSLKSVLSTKEAQYNAKMVIAQWAIVNCIPFNALDCPLFQKVVDAIAAIGPGFKAPNAYDFRVNLLKDWKKECQLLIESHRAKWKENGCTLMADGWTDVRQRTLINFLVYSIHGMVFVKSIDASNVVKDAKTLLSLFCEVIEWVGPENLVHVVTDNAANYVACGKLIKEKYKTIYWSPCAAHCLNLVLRDIASMPHVSNLATKASKITIFAYNHTIFLSWLRKRPGWKEIVRPGATRFATTFITLHSIYLHKHDLQALAIDKHFVDHKLARTEAGRTFSAIVLDNRFWNECYQVVKIVSPLMRLLRIVDSDEKPSLPYVYEGMQRAKNGIKEIFQRNKELYKPYTNIIQARWDKHLKQELHAAAYMLNPAFLYNPTFIKKNRLQKDLIDVFESFSNENLDFCTMMQQVFIYRDRKDSFDRFSCEKAAQKLDPHQWWSFYGSSIPELQQVAIRILSQTSSSSGCERNWSLFERIHNKRRNRLEHERLNDLVFTNYNLRLKDRNLLNKKKTNYDPIDYESIDKVDFWVVEDATPEFDSLDEINFERVANNEDIATTSTFEIERHDEGDEDMHIPEPPPLNDDDITPSACAGPSVASSPPPSVSMPMDLNEVNDNFGVDNY
ncbi:uncharacterized protein LOC114752370 [Neltuma alba]|uniref:uncharacterized protein LOC114752370 n=1 Tax=Neltuma alba TaxID=207710 RepID=UPI0010A55CE9|nr:uncharacterized protein LOC114752370 [Prosopis alba]